MAPSLPNPQETGAGSSAFAGEATGVLLLAPTFLPSTRGNALCMVLPSAADSELYQLQPPRPPTHDASSSGRPLGSVGAGALHRAAQPHSGTRGGGGGSAAPCTKASPPFLGPACTNPQGEKELKLRRLVLSSLKGRDPVAWSLGDQERR